MHIRNIIKSHNAQLAIGRVVQPRAWSFFLLAATILIFQPIYNTNDDVSMARMASGAYDGSPNPLLVYIHPLLGLVLSKLYAAAPHLPWYGIMMIAVLVVSCACIVRCIQSRYGTTVAAQIATLYATVVYFFAVLFVQYTTIASLVAMSGFIVLACETLRTERASRFMFAAGTTLVVVSFLIRQNAFLYAAALAAPLLAYSFFTASMKAAKKMLALCMGSIVLAVALLNAGTGLAYSQRDWKEYMQWSSVQAFYHAYDITDYAKNKEYYTKIGWSENDYGMFNAWFYTDAQRFSSETIAGIIDFAKKKNISFEGVAYTLRVVASQLLLHDVPFLIFFVFQLFTVVSAVHSKRSIAAYGATIVLGLSLIIYFSFLGRLLPNRLLYPLLLMISLYGFFLFQRQTASGKTYVNNSAIACAALLLFFLGQLAWYASSNGSRIAQYNAVLQVLPKGSFIFNWDSSLPMQWTSVFDALQGYRDRDIAGTGWVQRSPYDRALFERYGIRDAYNDIIDNPRAYLVARPEYLDLLKIYMREHYHKEINVVAVRSFPVRDEGLSPPLAYVAQLVQIKSVQQ